jgi:hypothetical protein
VRSRLRFELRDARILSDAGGVYSSTRYTAGQYLLGRLRPQSTRGMVGERAWKAPPQSAQTHRWSGTDTRKTSLSLFLFNCSRKKSWACLNFGYVGVVTAWQHDTPVRARGFPKILPPTGAGTSTRCWRLVLLQIPSLQEEAKTCIKRADEKWLYCGRTTRALMGTRQYLFSTMR